MFNWLADSVTQISSNIATFFYGEGTENHSQSSDEIYVRSEIREEFVYSDQQAQRVSKRLIKQVSPYIGSIENGFHSGMGCLLNDGTLLTALHVIYDFEMGEYRPLELITISFLKENQFYHYKIDSIIHDGTAALRAVSRGGPSTYDYARLQARVLLLIQKIIVLQYLIQNRQHYFQFQRQC